MTSDNPVPIAEPEKKSLFDTAVVSTPVILTVIATFILGRSSSEMTQAQYQRSVAGQNQSKVADQWGFFQAKRIRGTNYETTAITLLAQKADPFTPDTLTGGVDELAREIQLAEKETPALRDSLAGLSTKVQEMRQKLEDLLHPSSPDPILTPAKVRAAFDALTAYPEPKADSADQTGIDAEQRRLLNSILDDIRKFKPDKEIAPRTLELKPETIDLALEQAQARAGKIAAQGKQLDIVLEHFDALVDSEAGLCRELQRVLNAQLSALIKSGADAKQLAPLEARLERVRNLSARLIGAYYAARYAFDAKRYESDARSNQEAAYLYDVQVLQSSAQSDKHLRRSLGFMIAMLIAQVGVTVGSLALMLKFRLPVWSVAVLSGLCAIGLGTYIFFEWWGPLF